MRSHSFGHYPSFMTIGENRDKNCFENWEIFRFWQFLFHCNRIVQSSHYSTSLVYSGIQFFVLPSVTRKCNPKILELLYMLQCHSIYDQGFLKDEVPQFWPSLISFRRCCMHLQSNFRFCGKKQNQIISELQTTDFAIFIRGTLINLAAFVDSIHVNIEKERCQNAPLPESNAHMERLWLLANYPNINFRSAVKWLKGTYQLIINAILLQNLAKSIGRNSFICFFKIDNACKEIFAILPRFREDLPQSKDLVHGAATQMKTALIIFQF